jgi:uncharacterized protein
MQIMLTQDVAEFSSRAEAFLAQRLERNVMATITQLMLTMGPGTGAEPPIYALGVDHAGATVAAALRTPPRHLIASGFVELEHAQQLMAAWIDADPGIAGVSAAPAEAAILMQAWRELAGGETSLDFSEALHELETVVAPTRMPSGFLRRATSAEEDLLVQWNLDFTAETGFGDPASAELSARRTLAAGRSYVWDDDGPVTMVGHATRVADATRVGPVYTPPQQRGHGYASAAVAALSQQLLDAGARRCMLFTDLANATSNKIYEAVGYRRFADWEEHSFLPRSAA